MLSRRPEARPLGLAVDRGLRSFGFLFFGQDLLGFQEQQIPLLVIPDGEPAGPPLGKDGFLQVHLLVGRALPGLLADAGEDLHDRRGKQLDLLFLDEQADQAVRTPALQVEDP